MLSRKNTKKEMSTSYDWNDCTQMEWSETPFLNEILHENSYHQNNEVINNGSLSNYSQASSGFQVGFTETNTSLIYQNTECQLLFIKEDVSPDISSTVSINDQFQVIFLEIESIFSKTSGIKVEPSHLKLNLEIIDKLLISLDEASYNFLLSKQLLEKTQKCKLDLEKLAFYLV